ncbi:Putative mycofactocin radical SAM maturase MftC [Burkholderiales bacterium]|nr:Putative mycofactocin radical SAM maturase MftC [Burkholderiales bacterium]
MKPSYRPQRLRMQWHITDRCNLRCAHCYQENFRDPGFGMADWLPILEQFRAFLGGTPQRIPGHITVTGGEPFAHAEFPALLERFAALRGEFTFAILCNGTLIDPAMARRLAAWAPRYVQVSIDGTPATHDALRGKGQHAAAVAGIKHLVAAGLRVMIAFTAQRDNFREFSEVVRLGQRLRVARVWADRMIPSGQGQALQGLSVEETREFIELMRQTQLQATSGLKSRIGPRTEVALHRALQFLGGGPAYRCTAGDTLITVMPDGTLYPCRRLPIDAGNLHHTPLATLYDGALFRRLRDPTVVASGCAACVYERLCRGGLRCLSQAVESRVDVADPGCWLATR